MVNHAGFFSSHRLPHALAARDAGYEVHVATPRSKHVPRITSTGLEWHPIRLSRTELHPFEELQTCRDLLLLYRSLRPDLVHHVTAKPVLYGTAVARIARVPAVVNAIAGTGNAFANARIPKGLLLSAAAIAYRLTQRHPRMRVIFQNREQMESFTARHWVRASDAVLIPGSGVDLDAFHPAGGARDVPVVGLASRMLFSKGVKEFVAAAARLKAEGVKARFIVIGEPDPDNPDSIPAETLQQWAASGSVELLGRIEEMPAVFAGMDIFCLPTYYGEGVPKVLIEAAASGIPSITTDIPGCRDIVRNEVNGILVAPLDVEGLTAAIKRLIDDRDLRRSMGVRGRTIAQEFSLPVVIGKTLAIYREMVR